MENKNIEDIVKQAFSIGHSITNYYLLNYGINHRSVDLVISYSGSAPLNDEKFLFYLDDPHLTFKNTSYNDDDQIIVWKRHVKVYYKDSLADKKNLQFIFENGKVLNIKNKQDIFDIDFKNLSVNDFMIFIS